MKKQEKKYTASGRFDQQVYSSFLYIHFQKHNKNDCNSLKIEFDGQNEHCRTVLYIVCMH